MRKNRGIFVLPCAHETSIPNEIFDKSQTVDIITCVGCAHGWYYVVISQGSYLSYHDTPEEITNLYNSCSGKETKYTDAYGYFYYKELHRA